MATSDHFVEAAAFHLNITRRRRSDVHADVAEQHQPAILAEDLDLTGQAQISTPPVKAPEISAIAI